MIHCKYGLLFVLMLLALQPAHADRLVFQSGDALYVADADGQAFRRLFTIGRPEAVLWAPSPDGAQIAWLTPRSTPGLPDRAERSLGDKPVTLWIADLTGRRRRRLFSTDRLRDRLGRSVTGLAAGMHPDSTTTRFADWNVPEALAWSADSKSLYISCSFRGAQGGYASFIADAIAGTAVVDGAGRWKSIAPLTEVDVRETLLVGLGSEKAAYPPLHLVDLAQGSDRTLYARAQEPALSPSGDRIALCTPQENIIVLGTDGNPVGSGDRHPTSRHARSPRWSSDGKRLYFVGESPEDGGAINRKLYVISLPSGSPPDTGRRLPLPDIDRFFLIPN